MTRPTFRDADEVLAKQLQDAEFRAYWERTAVARAVALRLSVYRAGHGLSQAQLARLLGGCSSQRSPKIDTLINIAEALGIESW